MPLSAYPIFFRGGRDAKGVTTISTAHSINGELVDNLVHDFRCLPNKPPDWAWEFAPSIPFVGQQYEPGNGLLIYASAENFSWMDSKEAPERFNTDAAWNRYRAAYEEEGRNSEEFFPSVGIQPVTDGGLLAAGLFVAGRVGLPSDAIPRTFLETLAVSNWCKFTIDGKKLDEKNGKKNWDYISNVKKLKPSLSFVFAELTALRPRIALIPKAVWNKPILSAAMHDASPDTLFLPVFQFNTTVVNIHLTQFKAKAEDLRTEHKGTPLAEWMENLVGFNITNAWRYIAKLDELLDGASDSFKRRAARERILHDFHPEIVKMIGQNSD